ncbi:bifunctional phosphopantothenoylcysteine decarboxylase/phosphopantothenate--cysteine ligase CoaBC [Candidatus Micrarchaeota archaeon]|nr:bifunctional phosphopantothenoylcysteine decarboxylase/phosphopantothenate--cysteine ligase CoaBC [Candidatus Micrarchaeota archaeon]
MHSSKNITGSKGRELEGKRIALCVCGSVAAVKSPELARELMRHGAEVVPVMSYAATGIIRPELMHWATGNAAVTKLTGDVEHLRLCGKHGGKVDLVIVAPATANIIGKLASGIDDSPLATILTTALGSSIPIIIAPAMHLSISDNPVVRDNIKRLNALGVEFVEPAVSEGKAKMADINTIAALAMRMLYKNDLKGKKVLVTTGATREYIDDMRFISNPSSGRMGVELAKEAYLRGADVLLLYGHVDVELPSCVRSRHAETTEDMHKAVIADIRGKDIVVLAAAPADFAPERKKGKISSDATLQLTLHPVPKISDAIKKFTKSAKLILFKAESHLKESELKRIALRKLRACDADMIVANDVGKRGVGFVSELNEVLLIKPDGSVKKMRGKKSEIAKLVFDSL